MSRWGPITVEIVRGKPMPVMDRTITPVVRLISVIGQKGMIRRTQVGGEAWGIAWARPLAVVEERRGQAQVLPIPDVSRRILGSMAIVAALFPLLSLVLVWLDRRMRIE